MTRECVFPALPYYTVLWPSCLEQKGVENTVNVSLLYLCGVFSQRPKGSFYWLLFFFLTQVSLSARKTSAHFHLFHFKLVYFFAVKKWAGVLLAAPQGSSPPPRCSSGSFYEGEQWKVMGHKLLIRPFLGLIVGFVSAASVSVLPHSRGSNEALHDMMSPSGHQTIQWKVRGAWKRAKANEEKQGRKDEVIRENGVER